MTESLSVVEEARQRAEQALEPHFHGFNGACRNGCCVQSMLARDVLALAAQLDAARVVARMNADTAEEWRDKARASDEALSVAVRRVETLEAENARIKESAEWLEQQRWLLEAIDENEVPPGIDRVVEGARELVYAADALLGASFWYAYGYLRSELEEYDRILAAASVSVREEQQ